MGIMIGMFLFAFQVFSTQKCEVVISLSLSQLACTCAMLMPDMTSQGSQIM